MRFNTLNRANALRASLAAAVVDLDPRLGLAMLRRLANVRPPARRAAARAEIAGGALAEETGLLATRLERGATLFQAAGYSNQRGHVFVATGLQPTATDREASEHDMVAEAFPLREVEAMVGDGRISCMVTVAAIGLLRIKGIP